jgi:protein tyrosine phosphatase (PTP) superfamily phosphohydrolase (DUF442 family)
MSAIFNFHKVSDLLSCAGQPREDQLASIAGEGYKVIINLGLADGKYALNDEAASVKELGLAYHHIPVVFENPQMDDLASFIELMNKYGNEKIFVHCAANYRASVFTGLYLFATDKLNEEEMQDFIEKVWNPDQIWQLFIEDGLDFLNEQKE